MLQRLGQFRARSHASEVLGIVDLEVAADDGTPDRFADAGTHPIWIESHERESQAVFPWCPDTQVGKCEETSFDAVLVLADERGRNECAHQSPLLALVGRAWHGGRIAVVVRVPEYTVDNRVLGAHQLAEFEGRQVWCGHVHLKNRRWIDDTTVTLAEATSTCSDGLLAHPKSVSWYRAISSRTVEVSLVPSNWVWLTYLGSSLKRPDIGILEVCN